MTVAIAFDVAELVTVIRLPGALPVLLCLPFLLLALLLFVLVPNIRLTLGASHGAQASH